MASIGTGGKAPKLTNHVFKNTNVQICGSSFDATCGYIPAALYQCDEIGERPQPFKSCKSKVCEPDASTCGEDPCVCKVPGKVRSAPTFVIFLCDRLARVV